MVTDTLRLSFQPDKRTHAAGHPVATVGKKQFPLAAGTSATAIDLRDTQRIEAQSCQCINIGKPHPRHVTDGTTSHSTRRARNARQVAGYGEASRLRERV